MWGFLVLQSAYECLSAAPSLLSFRYLFIKSLSSRKAACVILFTAVPSLLGVASDVRVKKEHPCCMWVVMNDWVNNDVSPRGEHGPCPSHLSWESFSQDLGLFPWQNEAKAFSSAQRLWAALEMCSLDKSTRIELTVFHSMINCSLEGFIYLFDVVLYVRLALNSWSFCLSFLAAGITGIILPSLAFVHGRKSCHANGG